MIRSRAPVALTRSPRAGGDTGPALPRRAADAWTTVAVRAHHRTYVLSGPLGVQGAPG